VHCRSTLDIPLSAISVWGQIRDFQRYARSDLFHATIAIAGGTPKAGARLTLSHRYAGLGVERVGRILIWREGIGYSFSDLSLRGPRHGFPHVFSYRVEAAGNNACRLHVGVTGRWTTRHVPRWMAQLWLGWVMGQIVRRVSNELTLFRIWRMENERLRIRY
jgi:hypothetical protein